jgi:hypothetical protein
MERTTLLPTNQIFVFGSNRLGYHRRGAAKDAMDYFNAVYGQGEGLQGQAYAIPTKSSPYKSLSIEDIRAHVNKFLQFALDNKHLIFFLTPIGTGLANYKHEDIAPLFAAAPRNILLPSEWDKILA